MTTQKSLLSFFGGDAAENAISAKKQKIDENKTNSNTATVAEPVLAHLPLPAEDLPYGEVAKVFEQIEATKKRLIIGDILTGLFSRLLDEKPECILPVVYLSINRLGPTFEGLELGLGESLLMRAIAGATGKSLDRVKADVAAKGDLGLVAQASKNTQATLFKPPQLTVTALFNTLRDIAMFSGANSMQKKLDKIKYLLVSCQDSESKYLIRSLEGKLRIGLAEQSVLISLAQASFKHFSHVAPDKLPSGSTAADAIVILKSVFHELPNYNLVVPALIEHGPFELQARCHLTPGVPLKPMLAHPTKSITEVLNRFEGIPFTCEFKYDGERAQIHHLPNGQTIIFSRNCENITSKYPDIAANVAQFIRPHVRSFVLDCEVVAWDAENAKLLPFQILTTRKRKDVKTEDIKVKVCLFAFDMLYANGKGLLKESLFERRQIMRDFFVEADGIFRFSQSINAQSVEEIQAFFDESIKGNCEGLMVKTLQQDSSYEPSKRSRKWLKVKKDYIDGVGDSLDLVVIGGYVGKGKRTGTYGGYLLACYDPDTEQYQAICKIGTGFSDEDLSSQHAFFASHVLEAPKQYYNVTDAIRPDVWFAPAAVWEVKTADFSLSPIYTAAVGRVDAVRGISLRFPRFIRMRDDKAPENATSSHQIAAFYRSQQSVSAAFADHSGVEDDDEY